MNVVLAGADQDNYDRLITIVEASLGRLEILLAVCNNPVQQAEVIQHYHQELQAESIQHYQIRLSPKEPILRSALDRFVQNTPELDPASSVVTVLGTERLMGIPDRPDSAKMTQRREFYGYLQWRREALRDFPFPVILWLDRSMYQELMEYAPDFWSWRGGVFWFGIDPDDDRLEIERKTVRHTFYYEKKSLYRDFARKLSPYTSPTSPKFYLNLAQKLKTIEGTTAAQEPRTWNVNYRKLHELLKTQQWQAADLETLYVMYQALNLPPEDERLGIENIQRLPAKDLQIIDRLWTHASHDRYGLSVQAQLWQDCGSPREYSPEWEIFGDRVGWRVKGQWQRYPDQNSNQRGCLPSSRWVWHYPGSRVAEFALAFSKVMASL